MNMFTCRDIALTMTHLMEGERSELATISPTSDGVHGEINPKKPRKPKVSVSKNRRQLVDVCMLGSGAHSDTSVESRTVGVENPHLVLSETYECTFK